MLSNIGLSHCCGACLGRMQVESASKCFAVICPSGSFAAPWCAVVEHFLRPSQHLFLWLIPFPIKVLAKYQDERTHQHV